MTRLLLPLSLLCGCINVTEENFVDLAAEYTCKAAQKCDLGQYEATYDSFEECHTATYGVYEGVEDLADLANCTWDEEKAEACIDDLRAADCGEYGTGDIYANCTNAWGACGQW